MSKSSESTRSTGSNKSSESSRSTGSTDSAEDTVYTVTTENRGSSKHQIFHSIAFSGSPTEKNPSPFRPLLLPKKRMSGILLRLQGNLPVRDEQAHAAFEKHNRINDGHHWRESLRKKPESY